MSALPPLSVFIAVTHLLGVGHLSRMAALGRALAAAGHRVTLASGGRPSPTLRAPGVEIVQLPPVHCVGTDFATLLDADGAVADAAYRARRVDALLAAFATARPDVLVTELFPFGRRQLADEFEALLAAARARPDRPAVLASVRDILNPPSKPSRADEALARLGAAYDRVLVHGDARLAPLSASWPVAPELARRLAYTGYVAEADMPRRDDGPGAGEIVVSGGGSAASLPLYDAALGAAALLGPERRWRVLVGHGVHQAAFDALAARAPAHVTVERARPDFRAVLARCAVSVSQAGYNTMVELMQAGARAVVAPFEAGKEQEQALRAACFEKAGLVSVVREADLDAVSLAGAVRARLAGEPPRGSDIDVGGLARSVALIEQEAAARRREAAAWARLDAALASLAASGRRWTVWWRDDDAVEPTPELDRLLALARAHGVALALAVIPARATPALAARLAAEPRVRVMPHGWAHANLAGEGEKKRELTAADPELPGRLAAGLARLADLFGPALTPALAPPWNRIDAALTPRLAGLGFTGLSTFKPRKARLAAPGLVQVNTHWDPIAWKQGGGLREPAELVDELAAHAERIAAGTGGDEPFGLLTHHLAHDAWTWRFLEAVLARLARSPAVAFADPGALFAQDGDPRGAPCATKQR
ncbi:glycosyl transferase family 28 [Alsobacter sp. SYSU M60028]|uniref:Glycosyl transferase family 28 n=1 Tax=Alsobacter ponti TaxID=2962936 RepID=A0ABT1LDM4_9HYPH|nr:glycosyltransferase [Alsobacter ponti]MCP8939206.1 glycosyl transferase family 28 [Alsobacter ponti]